MTALRAMPIIRELAFAAAFVTPTLSTATARDLNAIAELVTPAYTAMNFTALCAKDDPSFLADARGPRGDALKYAEHVKNEAITSLTHDEAIVVLRTAADEARAATRLEISKIIPTRTYRYPQIAGWCRNAALSYVRTFIVQHDTHHEALLQALDRAKH